MTEVSPFPRPLRKLYLFPIVHTHADMGTLGPPLKEAAFKTVGRAQWKRKQQVINQFWNEVERVLDGLSLPMERVRVYQDGLPVCGRETEIVAEQAKAGSRNHALLSSLLKKGAHLMGTESPELLREEYEANKKIIECGASPNIACPDEADLASLLEKRDVFIAARIDETLRLGETGLIFLGMLHSLEALIPRDIEVIHPMPAGFASQWRRPHGS